MANGDVFITRTLDAPRNLVWKTWTEPDHTPEEMEVTVQFEEQGDKTKMTLRHKEFFSEEMVRLCTQGWNESLDKFERTLETFNEKSLNR